MTQSPKQGAGTQLDLLKKSTDDPLDRRRAVEQELQTLEAEHRLRLESHARKDIRDYGKSRSTEDLDSSSK